VKSNPALVVIIVIMTVLSLVLAALLTWQLVIAMK